jgi:hypothetical protein
MHRGEDDSGIACTLETYSIVIAVVCLTFRPLATLAQDGYPRKLYEDICAAYGSNYSEPCETDEYENAFSRVLGDFLFEG